ncbi:MULTISPECIES: SpaA isopeptide-forming pilin-related protein [Listeria]|uniref:SpaA isopeptide-forming pilin-related protein n=1 Tax=Listeria TaxID=1637 RepID=UPI000B593172|nr:MULTISPECIES: SpaA isopeptide-forming pilin-related protein [Listeria]
MRIIKLNWKLLLSLIAVVAIFMQSILTPLTTVRADSIGETPYMIGRTDTGLTIKSSLNPRPLLKSTGNSSGKMSAWYGGYETSTAFITIDGEPAFCIDPDLPFPVNKQYAESVYKDEGVYNILYYGYPANGTSEKNYVDTYVALNVYLGAFTSPAMKNDSGVKYLLNKAESKTAPMGEFDISNKTQTATWNNTSKLQETLMYPVKYESVGGTNYQHFNLPAGVAAVADDGTKHTGNVTLNASKKWKLVADANFDGTVSFDVTTDVKKKASLKFTPVSGNSQRIMKAGGFSDPLPSIKVSATFKAQLGNIEITKTSEDNKVLANAEYDIKDSSNKVVAHVKTDANGKATAKDLQMGTYSVVETKAPNGFTINTTPQKATVKAKETTKLTFKNKEVLGQFKITKQDSETGAKAQGDATLKGAVYGIYSDSKATQKVSEITTDASGKAVSEKLKLGTYYFKELKAPQGYNLDKVIYEGKLTYENQTTELVFTHTTLKDNVIKGNVEFVKFADKPLFGTLLDGQKQALEGAEFTLTLDSDGQEFGKTISDKDGKASFKNVPYGTYTVSETKAPQGYKKVADFKVTIDEQGRTYHYILEDKVYSADMKFVKKDAETGKIIPLANTEVKFLDSKGEVVKQTINYPTKQTLESFKTSEDGTLITPQPFVFGNYTAVEIKAPNGYLINSKPVPFTINEKNADGVVVVEIFDMPAKGKIQGHKEFEVIDNGKTEVNKSVYKFIDAKAVEFDVIAKEDIMTLDGTVRVKKGEKVDHVVTDEKGQFETSKELYLGKYELVETKTNDDYVLAKPVQVELTYKDQNTVIVFENVNIKNYLKKGTMEFTKKDITNGKELPGAKIKIYNQDKKVVREGTTDKNGKIYFKKLSKGKYFFQEYGAPQGYKLDDSLYSFEVKSDGEIVKCEMTNKPIEKLGVIPKTGDSSMIWLVGLGAVLVGLSGLVLVKRARKEK